MPHRFFSPLLLLVFFAMYGMAQSQWRLVKDENGIKVYIEDNGQSKFKAVRVQAQMHGRLERFDSLMRDVNNHKSWIYNVIKSNLIKTENRNEFIYYSETSLPWPLANRDVVSDMTISMDSVNKVVHVMSHNVNNIMGVNDRIVRIPFLKTDWTVTAEDGNSLKFDYYFSTDPGGSIPAWMVNSFAAKGPYNTFLNLKNLLAGP